MSEQEREAAIAEEMAAYYNAEGDYMDGSTVRHRLAAFWDRARASLPDIAGEAGPEECDVPPFGWRCIRAKGHEGPCAAIEDAEGPASVERGMKRLREAGYFTPDVLCPVCASVAGQPCTDFMGKVRPEPHAERRKVTEPAAPHPVGSALTDEQIEHEAGVHGNYNGEMGQWVFSEYGELTAFARSLIDWNQSQENQPCPNGTPNTSTPLLAAVAPVDMPTLETGLSEPVSREPSTASESAHPKPAAPATADDAVSETEFLALVRSYGDARQDENSDRAAGWIRDIRRALRSGASAQPAGGAK